MTCINCGSEESGKYCSNCSQKLEVKRLTFKEGWYDFWARVYGFDGMFPRTFRDLTFRPGFASLEFIRGNRARYYGPVGYFFLMITCYLLLMSLLDIDLATYMKDMQSGMMEQKETKMSGQTRNFIADNWKLIAFIYIPFQAFASRYVFFRKQNLNFIEHSVLPLYVLGHWYWAQMVEVVIYKITGSHINVVVQLALVGLYMGFSYTSFVKNQSKVKAFIKGVGVYVIGYMLVFLVAILVGVAIALTMFAIDPSSLDAIRPSKNP
jgi:Protein of unknown function (DUF3667)